MTSVEDRLEGLEISMIPLCVCLGPEFNLFENHQELGDEMPKVLTRYRVNGGDIPASQATKRCGGRREFLQRGMRLDHANAFSRTFERIVPSSGAFCNGLQARQLEINSKEGTAKRKGLTCGSLVKLQIRTVLGACGNLD
jgi:hypothetical protein